MTLHNFILKRMYLSYKAENKHALVASRWIKLRNMWRLRKCTQPAKYFYPSLQSISFQLTNFLRGKNVHIFKLYTNYYPTMPTLNRRNKEKSLKWLFIYTLFLKKRRKKDSKSTAIKITILYTWIINGHNIS